MITIKRDLTTPEDRFTCVCSEPGTGWRSYSRKRLTFPEAIAIVAHYFGQEHDNHCCPYCLGKAVKP